MYVVRFMPEAEADLLEITDRRVRAKIIERAEELSMDPDKQGKPLAGKLASFRSVRAVGQRYRIIYEIVAEVVTVLVVGVGIRKEGSKGDIYLKVKKRTGRQ